MRWNLRRWLHEHSLKLLAIRDTPEAIAGGVAIGVFFGFVPLFGLKTVSAIGLAWLLRCNILAAVLAGAAHDLIFFLMPAIYLWEYKVGFWALSHPHRLPPPVLKMDWHLISRSWKDFFEFGWPLLLGGILCATPISLGCFFVIKRFVAKHQRSRAAEVS